MANNINEYTAQIREILREPVLILQVITLLDSICHGLIYPFISPHMLNVCCDHFSIGFLVVSTLIFQLLSEDVTKLLSNGYGKKYILFQTLTISFLSHFLSIMTNSFWIILFSRCLFSIINQSQNLCKQLLQDEDDSEHTNLTFNILSASGYIIGPIIGGCLFTISYSKIVMLAITLTLLNMCLVLILYDVQELLTKSDPPEMTAEKNILEKVTEETKASIDNLCKADIYTNWDLILCKYLFASSISTFFTKFSQILKFNFCADFIVIGYSTSYLNLLNFIGTYAVQRWITIYEEQCPMFFLAQYSFLTLLASLLLACYACKYSIFAMALIPVVVAKCYIDTTWMKLFKSRNNPYLINTIDTLRIASGLTTPIPFGILCNAMEHNAVILFSVLPLFASIYILSKYTSQTIPITRGVGEEKNKED